jgi:hypothetical protein
VTRQSGGLGWLPTELAPVALRLARADELEYQLGWECLEWSVHALEMKQVRRPDGLIDVVVASVRPIPPVVSMLFSEIVNHLRAAIDNVMFHVVETLHGGSRSPDAAYKVAMPIYQSADKLLNWSSRNKNKVPEFDSGTELFRRVESLQPYKSLAVATAISSDFEPFVGKRELHGVHPLTLLQGYSNGDKHRAIRLAAGRMIPNPSGQRPGLYDIAMQPVDAGLVVAEGCGNQPEEVDARTAVHVQRPDGQIWVAPGAELAQIHTFVSDVVIPTLVTGGSASPDLPRQVQLDDTGATIEERLEAGGNNAAHDRVGVEAWKRAQEMENDPPQILAPPGVSAAPPIAGSDELPTAPT